MKNKKLLISLLIIYILVLTWIIVFKIQIDFSRIPHYRKINLIPLKGSAIVNGKLRFTEIIDNIIIFIPLGVYLGMLFKNKKFIYKVLPIFGLSLVYEIIQFIFAIGASDITDIITNTLGGIIGIVIINGVYRVFKNTDKVDKVLKSIALIDTILIISFILFIILVNI